MNELPLVTGFQALVTDDYGVALSRTVIRLAAEDGADSHTQEVADMVAAVLQKGSRHG